MVLIDMLVSKAVEQMAFSFNSFLYWAGNYCSSHRIVNTMHFLVISTQHSSLSIMECACECYKPNGQKCEPGFIRVLIDVPVVILSSCIVHVKW